MLFNYYYSHDECKDKFKFVKNKKCKAKNVIKGMDPIKYLNFLLIKTRNIKFEKILLYREIVSIDYYWNITSSINKNFEIIYNILDKTIKSRFLSTFQKNKIQLILNNKTKTIK